MKPLGPPDVARYYRWLLDREPDPAALSHFSAGSNRLTLVRTLVASAEFAMRQPATTGAGSADSSGAEPDVRDPAFWQRYDPAVNHDSPVPFREVVSEVYRITADEPSLTLRSSRSSAALALLYGLGKDHWSGAGEIVEFGVDTGLTTRCLSQGVFDNTRVSTDRKAQRLYAFDRFRIADMAAGPIAGRTEHAGSGFAAFMSRQCDEIGTIVPCPGELTHLTWGDHPIEVLVIDGGRSWPAQAWTLQRLFPHLMPGRSIVVQANRGSTTGYWRHLVMARFADRFEILPSAPGSSPSYLCRSAISPSEAAIDLSALAFEEQAELFQAAINRHPESARAALKTAYAAFLTAHGQ